MMAVVSPPRPSADITILAVPVFGSSPGVGVSGVFGGVLGVSGGVDGVSGGVTGFSLHLLKSVV